MLCAGWFDSTESHSFNNIIYMVDYKYAPEKVTCDQQPLLDITRFASSVGMNHFLCTPSYQVGNKAGD